jgi:hypothetical protein
MEKNFKSRRDDIIIAKYPWKKNSKSRRDDIIVASHFPVINFAIALE